MADFFSKGDKELGDRVDLILDSDEDTQHEIIYHNNLTDSVTGITFQSNPQLTDYTAHLERLPLITTVFEDKIPQTPKLTVEPFAEDPFYANFKIDASDDDLWYGIIHVDKKPIKNQYDGAILHLPFNDAGAHGSAVGGGGDESVKGHNSIFLTPGIVCETVDIDVSDNEVDNIHSSPNRLPPGTPIVLSGLTNVTNPVAGRQYYLSETTSTDESGSAQKYKLTTDPDGSAIGDITFAGSDDSDVVGIFNLGIANLAYKNNTDTHTSNGKYSNILGRFRTSAPSNYIDGISSGLCGPYHSCEGLAGNCLDFGGKNVSHDNTQKSTYKFDHIQYHPPSGNVLGQLAGEASFVAHIVPAEGLSGTTFTVINSGPIHINYNANTSQLEVDVFHAASNNVRLTSDTIPADGSTPTCIIVTFDKNLKSGNCKLFIDGQLQDQTGSSQSGDTGANGSRWKTDADIYTPTAAVQPFTIGVTHDDSSGHNTNNGFVGFMEEIVVYDRVLYPIAGNQKSFVFTKPLQEISNGSPIAYSARLFMKDYHNIRGDTTSDVATSPLVSFRKSAFRLGA